MAKKSIKKNYIYNLCYQVLLLLTPLITTPYISRILGADGIGVVSYAESIVSYFSLFATMGITTYGQREISYVQDSIEKRSVVFWNTKVLSWCTSGIALVLYLIFAIVQKNSSIYLILTFNILAVTVDITWFFQGMEEFGKVVLRNIIFKFASIAYIFLFIRSKEDISLYVFGLAFFLFLSNASLWGYIKNYVRFIEKKDVHPFRDMRIVWSLFVPTIAIQIYTVLDKTMIGAITKNSFENGYYEQALKISKMVLVVVTALGTVMIPRIGYHFEQNNRDEIKRLICRGYRFVWFLGIPLCIGLIMVAPNFVPWFFGDGYVRVIGLLRILSLLILAIGINNVTGVQYLIPTKRQNVFTFTVIIGACTNLILNIVLIKSFQSIGAAVASVVAEITIAIVQLIIIRKEINPLNVLREGFNYYVAGGIMGTLLFFLTPKFNASIINTFVLVVSGALTYFASLLILKDEFLLSNVKTVTGRLKKG